MKEEVREGVKEGGSDDEGGREGEKRMTERERESRVTKERRQMK